jgi:pimeloyl-ACP methyl ester carboxylesterase
VHGNGFCKELWLPMVDDVAERLRSSGSRLAGGATRIDFIGLDLPNHGDSQAIPFPLDWSVPSRRVLRVSVRWGVCVGVAS